MVEPSSPRARHHLLLCRLRSSNLSSQRGSILMDTVLFMALLSVLLMALVGQLTFMTKVSAQEDARVQGLMAARIQMEDMRTQWDYEVPSDSVFTVTEFEDSRLAEEGFYSITQPDNTKPIYQIEIEIKDKAGKTVYETLSQVWVK
jgi:type II secretory pathway pseudopilin PulG